MDIKIGNIWDFVTINTPGVVPTNIGWKSSGENVMGRGVAKQAATIYPDLSLWYGNFCQQYRGGTGVVKHPNLPIILFPVKPLNENKPWYSWGYPADIELIERSTKQLANLELTETSIYIPLVGCGNGGLDIDDVFPLLKEHLDERFTLIVSDQDYKAIEELL